jgi:hypothetical protein
VPAANALQREDRGGNHARDEHERCALAAALLLTAGTLRLTGSAAVADHTNYYVLSPTLAEPGNPGLAAASSPALASGRYRLLVMIRDGAYRLDRGNPSDRGT